MRRLQALTAGLLLAAPLLAAPPALVPPSAETVAEARALVDGMKRSERGPYRRIRWFCNDGTVHPPQPYACAERGGGHQHAEYSEQRARLAELGWHVGTIFAALGWDELADSADRHARLRELALEHYLVGVDDGWVLRRARLYRGRVQAEDEDAAGRELMLQLLADRRWVTDELLLVRETLRAVPHGAGGDRSRAVRQLAEEMADRTPSFAELRIEIHSRPEAGTAERIRTWVRQRRAELSEEIADRAEQIAATLDELYGAGGRRQRLARAADRLAKRSPEAARLIRASLNAEASAHISNLAQAMERLRLDLATGSAAFDLLRLDLLQELEAEVRTAGLERLQGATLTRRGGLELSLYLLDAAWAGGTLSSGEREALSGPVRELLKTADASPADYAFAVQRLSLAAGWAAQAVRYAFAEPLVRYRALEPRTERFVDELLRGSVLLPLGVLTERLSLDGATVSGLRHRILGQSAPGVVGLNPGAGRGRLRVLEADELEQGARPAEDEIAVLTRAVADLPPVAGILTLGEGNPLSHVQMLARNLGIPNAVIPPDLLPALRGHAGESLLLAVARDGRVLLEPADRTGAAKPDGADKAVLPGRISAPSPELSVVRPVPLAALRARDSGRLVGPKAANLGELNRLFPGRIAPAIALPFGVFAAQTAEPRRRVAEAFRRQRVGEIDQTVLDSELDKIRAQVGGLRLDPELREELEPMMTQAFGPKGSYGLFVRSDTNVEDLPGFTGAGLNETVPNVVGLDAQLAAVPRVWSSVYTRRAMAWRARILADPAAVFVSVLLMKSVPSEKSGVLVTRDLAEGGEGLTVSVAWGVGGAVDNESAATLVLRPDGSALRVSEAKAPYRRVLDPAGGLRWLPAAAGPVLSPAEQAELRRLAAEVIERYPRATDAGDRALPWDLEFAFAEGKLWLLQIRPLVERGGREAERVVDERLPRKPAAGRVVLDLPLAGGRS